MIVVAEDKNIIPEMTNPLGKHWDQPEIESILIDGIHAVMDLKTMKSLKDYSRSVPTGAYTGKMWRCSFHSSNHLLWYRQEKEILYIENRLILIA